MAQEEHPRNNDQGANPQGNTINLDITCNKIQENEIGILGCGNLKSPQPANGPNEEAGNNFDNGAGTSKNTNWDILWENPTYAMQQNGFGGQAINYYYFSYTPNSGGLNQGNVTINGFSQGSISGNFNLFQSNNNTPECYNLWKKNPSTHASKPQNKSLNIKIAPNPFDESVRIQFKKSRDAIIRVKSLHGKEILHTGFEGQKMVLNTSKWHAGTYFIKVVTQKGKVHTRKLLKVE